MQNSREFIIKVDNIGSSIEAKVMRRRHLRLSVKRTRRVTNLALWRFEFHIKYSIKFKIFCSVRCYIFSTVSILEINHNPNIPLRLGSPKHRCIDDHIMLSLLQLLFAKFISSCRTERCCCEPVPRVVFHP